MTTQWNTYLAALTTHEVGHRSITVEGAGQLRRMMLGVNAPRCDQIAGTIRTRAEQMIARIQADNVQYDTLTHRGITQGAVWPPRSAIR